MADAEKPSDFGTPPAGTASQWFAEIKAYEKAYEQWEKRGDAIVKRYRAESATTTLDTIDRTKRFNVLWSNVQTLQPALYGRVPKPDVSRTHKDKSPVARAAAVILERACRTEITTGGFDEAMRAARDDYLLPGRGTIWVRYVPTYGEETRDKVFLQADTADDGSTSYTRSDGKAVALDEGEPQKTEDGQPYVEEGDPYQPVIAECVKQEHVAWKDFGHTPAPTWSRVRAVWKKERMTRQQLIDRFGEEKGKAVQLTKFASHVDAADAENHGDVFKRGEVVEIWDRTSGKVLWISKGYADGPLDEIDDPLHLEGFFPCPRPIFATLTTDSLVPVADYDQYRSEAEDLDRLTQRIGLLTEALRVAGAYDGSFEELGTILKPGNENRMVKVDNWAMFSERGGVQGAMSFLPLKEIAETLQALSLIRDQKKKDLYEITGISDIVRGQADANETLGAQEIKRQFVGLRISDRKEAIQRFARDIVQIGAEIIAEHFSPETLWEISGWQHTDDARALDEARAEWESQAQTAVMAAGPAPGPGGMPPMPSGPPLSPPGSAPQAGGSMPTPPGIGPDGAPDVPPPPSGATPISARPPSAKEVFDQAVELLRSDRLRGYTIDIETDSMVIEDQNQEKQQAVEFVTSVSTFLEQAVPAVQLFPDIGPMLVELLMFAVRRFKVSQSFEGSLEAVAEGLAKTKKNPTPPPPDPKVMAMQAQQALDGHKLELEHQRGVADASHKQNMMQMDAQHKQLSLQQDAQHKQLLLQHDAAHKQATVSLEQQRLMMERDKLQADLNARDRELAIKERELELAQADQQMRESGQTADHKLKLAAHNKQVVDEASALEAEPSAPNALDVLVKALAELAAAITAGEQRQTAEMGQLAQVLTASQAEQGAQIRAMVDVLAAPKRVVRGTDNRIAGVETIQ